VKSVSTDLDVINCKAVEERGFILKEKNCSYDSDRSEWLGHFTRNNFEESDGDDY